MNASRDSSEDVLKQQGVELKMASKARRRIILKAAGCTPEVSVSAAQGAALRPLLGLSLTKYRQHKRFFKSLGVKFASEEKEKQQQRKAQCGEVQVELRSLVFVNEEEQDLRLTPVASITDVPSFVKNLLDEYDRQDRLTCHDGAIPDDEIWVKIGGDHGGGSFKLMLQIANLRNANSKFNTCLIAMAECKDYAENLRMFGLLKDQISALQTLT